jgi:poly(3-hydroxybutyrate) depolymerase
MNRYLLYLLMLLPAFGAAQLTARPAEAGRAVGFYEFLPDGYNQPGSYKYPLIINLHGSGEKGNGTTELDLTLQWGLGEMVGRQHATLKFNFFGQQQAFVVLLPQLSNDYQDWQNFYIDSMINYAKKNLNIDTNKIFLTGYSLGGGGDWRYPSTSLENARRIAGIVPAAPSPGYTGNDLCNIANGKVAVWAHHSVDDDAIDVQFTRDAINGINACSPDIPALANFYAVGMHNQTWLWAMDTMNNHQYPNMWEWMAGTTRLNTKATNLDPVANAGSDITLAIPATSAVLNGSASRDPNDVIVKYTWTQTAGPSSATIEKADYPVTNITNLQFGTYTFLLSTTDEFGAVKTDDVTVNVTGALPISFTYFKGKISGKYNNLTWATSTEVNADHFAILRSSDGINFIVIGSFAAGNKTYSFTDEKAPGGTSYYKLKNVDKDGAFTYSAIVTIDNSSSVIVLTKYPNPVKDQLTVTIDGPVYGKIEIAINDFQGKLVKKQTISKQDYSWKGSFNTGNLQKGIYTIQVLKAGSKKETTSFVKE